MMLLACCPALANAYSEHCGRRGRPWFPWRRGIGAVLVNLVLNYILIFGHFGVPAMVFGARLWPRWFPRYVELAIVASLDPHAQGRKSPSSVGPFALCLSRSMTGRILS